MNDEHLLSELREDPPQALADAFYLKMKEKEKMELALQAQKSNVVSVRWLRVVVAAAVVIVAVYFLFAQLENRPNSVQEQPILQTSATQTDPTPLPTQPSITIPVGATVDDLDATTIQHMKNAGITWVQWDIQFTLDGNTDYAASRIGQAHNAELKVLLSITPTIETKDAINEYMAFVATVASHNPDAIQVWKSIYPMPISIETTEYIEWLKDAYITIKEIDSDIMVITGLGRNYAVAESDFTAMTDYYAAMADADIEDFADCIGVTYQGSNIPPDAISIDPNSDGYFIPTLDQAAAAFAEVDIPLCITDLAYTVSGGYPQQAQYLIQALQLVSSVYTAKPVELVIVEALSSNIDNPDHLIDQNGVCLFCDLLAAEMNP